MTTNSKNALEFKQISASYNNGKHYCLENISFAVPRASIEVIMGPNGSGKSTLLKIINGLVLPSSGEIKKFCKKEEIGYIPQNCGLVPMLTVRENILMGALNRISWWRAIFKSFPAEDQEHANQLISELDLNDVADKKVCKISGGEKRRVAIGRALMQKPKLLLADEILSNLDCKKAKTIIKILKELKNRYGITIIMVEHNACFAEKLADKITTLKNGQITPVLKMPHHGILPQPA